MASSVEPEFLRIWRIQGPESNPLTSDFRLLGLKKVRGPQDRGRKSWTRYIDGVDVVVEIAFSDVLGVGGEHVATQGVFSWFREDGAVGLSKTEITQRLNDIGRQAEARRRRESQLDYIRDMLRAALTRADAVALFDRYHVEIGKYREIGSTALEAVITNEAAPPVLAVLATETPGADGVGLTMVGNAILYQIGA